MRNVRSVCLIPILVLFAALTVLAMAATTTTASAATTAATTAESADGEGDTPWIYIIATALGVGAVGVGAWAVSSVVVKNRQKER